MMKRRELLAALGLVMLSASFGAFPQKQDKVWRVGFLGLRRPASLESDAFGAFPKGMREFGYVEGKNLVIEWRFADGKVERLAGLVAELVLLKIDIIVAAGSQATSAAQKATATIPIVMAFTGDPVGSGFVKSLAQPGGNITGLSNYTPDYSSKHLEMLLSVVPRLTRVAVLTNPTNSSHLVILENVQAAALKAGVAVLSVEARTPQEIEYAFSKMIQQKTGAVIVAVDALFNQQQRQITELALKHRIPSIAAVREHVEAGGLMSYGQNFADYCRRAATYVDKIFKGAKPGELPVEQPTKLELFINSRTAKSLGITIPQSVLLRADEVIQ